MRNKKLLYLLISLFLLSGVYASAQDNSFGLAPINDQTSVGPFSVQSPSNVLTRGFSYQSTGLTASTLFKYFAGTPASVTAVGTVKPNFFGNGDFGKPTGSWKFYVMEQVAAPYTIYEVDTTTGNITSVGSPTGLGSGLSPILFEWNHVNNMFYVYASTSAVSSGQLYSMDWSTKALTPIGGANTTCPGLIAGAITASGTAIVGVDLVNDNIWRLNLATGTATLVGPSGYTANYGQDAGFDRSDWKLYWSACGGVVGLRSIDTATGVTAQIGTFPYTQVLATGFAGFPSSPPPVPTGTWTEQTSGLTTALYSVSAVNNAVAWIGGASSKILRTTNAGQTWTNAAGNLPTAQDVYCIWGFDQNNCVATTSPASGTFIYKTTDGGTTWTQTLSQIGGFMDGFYFINNTTGFAYGDPVGTRWSLFKTTNGGSTWDSAGLYIPAGGLAGWNNAMFGLGNKIWFGTNGTPLWYSANGGTSWTSQTTPAINQYAVWFNDDNVGLCGGANLNVTTNGGANWTALTSIGTGNISGIVGASTSWWFTRQATAVNFSSNNGTSWAAQYTAPAGNFYHLALTRSGVPTIWGVRSNGGISRYGQPANGITPINSEIPAQYNLSQNYPNPFNPTTKINFAIPKTGLVTIKVYDVAGKEVATLVNETKNAGSYSVDFTANNISSGVYFYKISAGDFSSVKKMMLIK